MAASALSFNFHRIIAGLENPFIFGSRREINPGGKVMVDEREDVYSKAVRAGKRTYFFDVRSTRGRDLYLTITESKKHTHPDGTATYDKHKIFLYKEDFSKFINGLKDAFEEIEYLRSNGFAQEEAPKQDQLEEEIPAPITAEEVTPFSSINFEDLDRQEV